jgi:cyclopropane fatty-acyl-phospholipid synthase-like methyltransferase
MLHHAKHPLAYAPLYVLVQRALGASRLRDRCLSELNLQPGHVVLDIGCGPAYYLNQLPTDIRYYGFDTSAHYIAYAKRHFSDRGQFFAEVLTKNHLRQLPPANSVLLLGLIHHLSDTQARDLLALAARALAPGGQVISIDTCHEPNQNRLSRWMSAHDRGQHVRTPQHFMRLAKQSFANVDGSIVNNATRIPSSHWLMRMGAPR